MVRGAQLRSRVQGDDGVIPDGAGQFLERGRRRRGVFEYRIDFGPGYRIYFGKDGEKLVVLLGGSAKKRQQQAIHAAAQSWMDYKRRKATA
jgi:putative addiction module killer protein